MILFDIAEHQTLVKGPSSAKTTITSSPGKPYKPVIGDTDKSTNIQFDTDFVAGALIGGFSCLTAVCLIVSILFGRSYFQGRSTVLCSRLVI